MEEYIFPTEIYPDYDWITDMIDQWKHSHKPNICFTFNHHSVNHLYREPIMMYLYYTKTRTEVERLKGCVLYRATIDKWHFEEPKSLNVHLFSPRPVRYKVTDPRIWLVCNRIELISNVSGGHLVLNDFGHYDDPHNPRKLASSIRSNIGHAKCLKQIKVLKTIGFNSFS
jgi:hypothetical protein